MALLFLILGALSVIILYSALIEASNYDDWEDGV